MTANSLPQGTRPNIISLQMGHPDPAALQIPELQIAMQQAINSPQLYTMLEYGPERGTPELLHFLVEKINREQGLSIGIENLMLVAGATHAVDMLARLYARPGGTILVEAPTYADAIHIFRDHQLELDAIPMDEQGLLPEILEKRLIQSGKHGIVPSFLYTIPNFHNPTGHTLPLARRHRIIELAHRYDFLIIEDDVYHDLAFEGAVPDSFYALANGQRVLSIGSFSKTLAPGLRLGWLLGAENIIQRCLECGTSQMGGGANPFAAHIVAQYCQGGHWETHLSHLQTLYRIRRDRMLSALSRYMPAQVQWTHPTGGFFIWLSLPDTIFAQQVKQMALQVGISLTAGEGFFVNLSAGVHNLRLTYSYATLDEIDAGISSLAQIIQHLSEN